jgi:hypothetical protein
VWSPDRAGVGGLIVRLVDKGIGLDVELADGSTDRGGKYQITVSLSATSLQKRLKTQPDLQVRVFSGDTFLGASEVRYNASTVETLDVALPGGLTALPSEYETLTAGLAGAYEGRLADLRETRDRQDITYLANKTGWDANAVTLAALAEQFSLTTAPAGGPAPEFYYALFRAGIPANADDVFQTSPKTARAIWEHAIKQGVIPQGLANNLGDAERRFATLSAAHTLDAIPPVGISTLREMLQTSLSDPTQQRLFAQTYVETRDDTAAFWNSLQQSLGETTTKKLQLEGQLFYLTLNNATVVQALHDAEKQKPLASTLELATRGYHDAAKWMPLVGDSIPPQIPGESADERRNNYAKLLATKVRLSFPTAVVADLVRRGTFTLSDQTVNPAAIADFLIAHQGKFAFGGEPIEAYIVRTTLEGTPPPVVAQIKRLQRVYQLTLDDESMAALLQHGLDSAYAIARYDAAGFARAFQAKLGGAANATAIHARAKQIHGAVLNIAMSYLGARIAPTLGGRAPVHVAFSSPSPNLASQIIAYPTLESLFGSLDYCNCRECRSILSPAAYLVDLLDYLDQPPSPGHQNPQDVLFQRRPHLQYLPLTCENTNTALPYIDIVNETLEYFIANNLSLANYQGHSTDSTASSAELMASPQYVNDTAYTTLQNTFFPDLLPYNRPLELLRLLLRKLGVRLPDVMATLRANDSVERAIASGYGWRDILMEQLSISREEYRLFTDTSIGLYGLYGYPVDANDPDPSNTVLTKYLQQVTLQDFSRRTGVSYDNLFSIIKTRFVNPNALITVTDPSDGPDQCSGAVLQFRYTNPADALLNATDFVRLIRFIRLWRKLGLSIAQTDDILTALYPIRTDSLGAADLARLDTGFLTFLPRVGFLFQIMDRLGLTPDADLPSLLACWAPIGTAGDNSLYRRMFLSSTAQELGPQTATVAGLVQPGDVLTTSINGVSIPAQGYTVQTGDTVTSVATKIAEAISTTTAIEIPIFASSQIGVITITGWFTLKCSAQSDATVTYTSVSPAPLSYTAKVMGTVTAGNMLTTEINGFPITYTVAAEDTLATIAANIGIAINETAAADPFSGLPLNTLVVASYQSNVITIESVNSGAPFGLACSLAPAANGTYTPDPPKPWWTATVLGSSPFTATFTTSINLLQLTYVTDGGLDSGVAAAIAALINSTSQLEPYSGLPLNSLVYASSAAGVITITPYDPMDELVVNCSVDTEGGFTYTPAGPFQAPLTAKVEGTFTPGSVLTTTITTVSTIPADTTPIPYTVVVGDDANKIAENIASAINATFFVNIASAAGDKITVFNSDLTPGRVLEMRCSLSPVPPATYTVGRQPSAFADDGSGNFLKDASQKLLGHEPILRAAFGLTGAEFTLIAEKLGFTASSVLNLDNITAIFRRGWLAQKLRLSVAAFLMLEQSSGETVKAATTELDPFAPLDPGATSPAEPPIIRFIRLLQTLPAAGLQPAQALYLMWNQDISGRSAPGIVEITGLARTLRADFAAVDTQFALKDDPDGGIAKGLMALVYGSNATDFFFGLLNNTLVTSVAYDNPQPTLAKPIIAASNARLAYDDLRKLLTYAGVLDGKTENAIGQAIGNDTNLRTAMDDLVGANHRAVDPFFASYNELLPLYTAYAASSDPPQQRRTALLAAFLPTLRRKRKQEQALASVTSAVGTDPSFSAALLQDATILHAAAENTAAAVTDLTAIEAQGLSARFLSNDPTGASEITVDADAALSYGPCVVGALQTATLGGSPKPGDILITTVNGLAVPCTVAAADTTPAILAGRIAAGINATTTPDPYSGLPLNSVVFASSAGENLTIKANNLKGVTLSCAAILQRTAAYSAGVQIPASQTATVAGTVTLGDELTTTVNGVAIPYTVVAADTTPTILAAHIAAAVNATTVVDQTAGMPLNRVVSASSSGGVITITAVRFGPAFSLACSVSAGAKETYTTGVQNPASQTATVAGLLAPGGVLITSVSGVAVTYTVTAGDTTETVLATNIAAAINASTTPDPKNGGQPLNALVSASSAGSVITVAARGPGVSFSVTCALSSYSAAGQFPAVQTAIIAGGITPGDVLTTTIDGVPVAYTVSSNDATVTVLAGRVAAAINATNTVEPVTGLPINSLVSASNTGGVVTIASAQPGAGFGLACSTSPGATETYASGPRFLAYQAVITGGFSAGDVLTTTINAIPVRYTVGAGDATAAILANRIAAAINATTTPDPVTGIPLNHTVAASSAAGIVTVRTGGSTFTLASSLSTGATETYVIAGALPASAGGVPIAGRWRGYLDAPQNGFYRITIATDPGAAVEPLEIGQTTVTLTPTQNRSIWTSASPISLRAGTLTPIALTATSLTSTLSMSWESLGLGRAVIPGEYLYSATLVDNLNTTYVRFLKAASLATALSLTASELAYLGTATSLRVNTSDSLDNLPAADTTFTPASMSNIALGSKLLVDSGAAQEIVTVRAVTPTTFSATTVNPHDGTAVPFPIVAQAFPNIGEGWLNFLSVSETLDPDIAASLRQVLTALADFALLKRSLSAKDERLLAILQNPAGALPDGRPALQTLTGWSRESLDALLQSFFGNVQLVTLSSIGNFRRIYDAFSIVRTCRISPGALIAATTNAPSATTVVALQSTLRALYAEPDWVALIRPINDTMRIHQRDALVAYILQQFNDNYERSLVRSAVSNGAPAGANVLTLASLTGANGVSIARNWQVQGLNLSVYTAVVGVQGNSVIINPGTLAALPAGSILTFVPPDAVEINTGEKLFEYFLIDVETQPPVETSRIRLALSSVQFFIERILRNLEPSCAPSDIEHPKFPPRWPWMKRYRVWQANREVFLWPENWLYPELRDDQSPFFQEMMSALLQSDITDDAAANAYLDYLTKLQEVAKLEPCGLYHDKTIGTSYVIARTAGAHRKHYFRQFQGGSWTPWTEVKIDCEDMPLTPIVWNGRLFLFWLKVLKQGTPQAVNLPPVNINSLDLSQLQLGAQASATQNQFLTFQAVLCWSEFYNGKWQPAKTSDINRPTTLVWSDPAHFDPVRNLWRIVPDFPPQAPNGSIVLSIQSPETYNYNRHDSAGGFLLYNTHSLPVRFEDAPPLGVIGVQDTGDRILETNIPINDTRHFFQIEYGSSNGSSFNSNAGPTITVLGGLTEAPRYVEPAARFEAWGEPFFFEDHRSVFYVTTHVSPVPAALYGDFAILPKTSARQNSGMSIQAPGPVQRRNITQRGNFIRAATLFGPAATAERSTDRGRAGPMVR